jgi:hypothetical protein
MIPIMNHGWRIRVRVTSDGWPSNSEHRTSARLQTPKPVQSHIFVTNHWDGRVKPGHETYRKSQKEATLSNTRISDQQELEKVIAAKTKGNSGMHQTQPHF